MGIPTVNARTFGTASVVLDPDELVLPYGLLGPVRRIVSDAGSIRRQWIRESVLWSLLATAIAGLPILIAGVVLHGLDSSVFFLEVPAVFWSVLALFLVTRVIVGARLAHRFRVRLEPVPWQKVGLDIRLDASLGSTSAARLGMHSATMSVLAIANAGLAMVAAGSYFWVFGPLSILFAIEALTAMRVRQLRRRRSPGPGEGARE